MAERSLEARLRQFGADLDFSADRRSTERSAPLVEPVELQARRPSRRRARVFLVAAVVALLTVVAALLIRSIGTTPPASGAPTWERLDSQTVGLPKRVNGGVTGTIRQHFIVVGSLGSRGVWSSPDGEAWRHHPLPNLSPQANVTGLATANGRSLVWTFAPSQTELPQLWSSRNGLAWREVIPNGLGSVGNLSIVGHDRTFIATGGVYNADGTITGKVWTSHDGSRWSPGALVGNTSEALGRPIWFQGRFIALGAGGLKGTHDGFAVWESTGGSTWTNAGQVDVPRLSALYAPPGSRRLYGIQFETATTDPKTQGGSFGGRLMASPDGLTWTEVRSFHDELPVANPDHILRAHGWWILSGNTGTPDGQRRTDIWTSRDLKHWTELPKHLQGAPNGGTSLPTAAIRQTVIGTALYYDHAIWRWQP